MGERSNNFLLTSEKSEKGGPYLNKAHKKPSRGRDGEGRTLYRGGAQRAV